MRYSRGSGPRPAVPAAFALAALGALAFIGLLPQGGTAQTVATRAHVDTIRTPSPFHFRKTVLFTPDYLSRVLESSAPQPSGLDIEIKVDPPSGSDRAATYADRYGISRELAQQILETATAEGLDPELGFRLIRTESRFKTRARGPRGALGLLQLMPSTARSLDRSLRTEAQILEPSNNLRVGFRYLRKMIERYDGDVRLGLLAYNRGEVAVDRALRAGRDPENGYSHRVLGTKTKNPYKGQGLLRPKK